MFMRMQVSQGTLTIKGKGNSIEVDFRKVEVYFEVEVVRVDFLIIDVNVNCVEDWSHCLEMLLSI